MNYRKFILVFIIVFLISFFPSVVIADETCTEGVDCEESINENTWEIKESVSNLEEYLSVSTSPIVLMDSVTFDDNMSELLQVFGIFAGFVLFACAFNIGLFLYKR